MTVQDSDTSHLAARRAALVMVQAVTGEGRILADIGRDSLAGLEPAGRAAANRLANGTLRWSDRADRLLGPYLRNKPYALTHNILRMAVFELLVAQEAAHGVVDSAVRMVGEHDQTRAQRGLVNAVLRNILRAGPDVWAALPPPRLPKPLRKTLRAAWGKAAVEAMEAAFAADPPLDLTPRDGDAPALAARLGGTVLPTGSVRLLAPGQVRGLPGYDTGDWWVQDAAAVLPVRVLAPTPGERVLDMCAAPGGKTLQMAAAGASVTALDQSEHRMTRVRENLERCRLSATCEIADAQVWESTPFDAVLVDAPCSATGTIRRHPDLPHAKAGADFSGLMTLQAALIDRAVALTRPGGRLVFCACSLLPDEGEAQAAAALARHAGILSPDRDALAVSGVSDTWLAEHGLRIRPDHWADLGGLDGFFIAAFRRL